MPRPSHADTNLLQAVLTGLQYQLDDIDRRMVQIRAELGGHSPVPTSKAHGPAASKPTRKRRPRSAAVRKRMAAAQRKRWARYYKAMKG